MSAENNVSGQLSPRNSGESASAEAGSPRNKGLVSCLRAIFSRTQPAELAATSKSPRRGKAIHPASTCNTAHCAQCRSECAQDIVLDGSTHGEASKQTQSRNMKHVFNRTNPEESSDSECPSSSTGLDCISDRPHFLTFDVLSSESEENAGNDDPPAPWWDTFVERDLITFPRTVSPPSSASTRLSHSLQPASSRFRMPVISDGEPVSSDEYRLTSVLKDTRESHMAAPSTSRLNRGVVAHAQWRDQHFSELQSIWQTSQTGLASPHRTGSSRMQATMVKREEDVVHKATITTEDTMQTSDEARGQTTPGLLDNLNVDDVTIFSDSTGIEDAHKLVQGGAAVNQDPISLKNSSKGLVCRPKQRLLNKLSNEERQCRICLCGDLSPTNPLLTPCLCSGSMCFTHLDCLKKWVQTRVQSGSKRYVVQRCELCMGKLRLDPHTFDWDVYFPVDQEQCVKHFDSRFVSSAHGPGAGFEPLVTSTGDIYFSSFQDSIIRMRHRQVREGRKLQLTTSDTSNQTYSHHNKPHCI